MRNDSKLASARHTATQWVELVGDWLAGLSRLQLGTLATIASALLVIQVLSLLIIAKDDSMPAAGTMPSFQRDVAASAPNGEVRGTFAIVSFKPKATAGDVAALLQKLGAEAVEGPKAGIWRVRLSRETKSAAEAEALLSALRADPAVAFASLAL